MRAKDEDGRLLPPPHKRLPNATALEQHAVFAISEDARCAGLPLARKLALVRKAIDHAVDGDAIPKWIYAKDKDRPENHVLIETWTTALTIVRADLKAAA